MLNRKNLAQANDSRKKQAMSNKKSMSDYVLDALNRSLAVIEFDSEGAILTANENFLGAIGYDLQEIQGKHHRLFVDREEASKPEYRQFWRSLADGNFQAAEYKRVAKGGREIWIQATYNPILDEQGKVLKVVKFATDITAEKLKNAEYEGRIQAISKAQAVIEFNLDGTIITANENFLGAVGYDLSEIRGRHHSMFVERGYGESDEYRRFWEDLRQGRFQAAEYKRYGKGGKEIWIQASYNPILDMSGKPFKVVKFASDVTAAVHKRQEFEKIVRYVNESLENTGQALQSSTQSAAAASTQTTSVVQTVASAAEELSSSIQEISRSINRSQSAVEDAMSQSNGADKATASLVSAADAMTSIVGIIQDITSQINLLALNATIESARAGEAGKGFAVVANEVKNLAGQARDAADKITEEINNMQGISGQVAGAMRTIRDSIGSILTNVNEVAAAIEQQSAVTSDISSNMQLAAQSTESINESINQVVSVAHDSKKTAGDIKEKLSVLAA